MLDVPKYAGQITKACEAVIKEAKAAVDAIEAEATALEATAGPAAVAALKGDKKAKDQAMEILKSAEDRREAKRPHVERSERWIKILALAQAEVGASEENTSPKPTVADTVDPHVGGSPPSPPAN